MNSFKHRRPGLENSSSGDGIRKDNDAQPVDDYFPEDERIPLEQEDDHSMTDFELPAAGSLQREETRVRRNGREESKECYFPEDERAPLEWEDDHSTTDFDLNAEIEAKLGKAPAAVFFSPEPPLCPDETDALFSNQPEGRTVEQYFPEDDRAPVEWEDDHSIVDFNPGESVAAHDTASSGPDGSPASGTDYFPEDERSHMERGDHYSRTTEIDIDAEIEAKLGPASSLTREEAPDEFDRMHSDLATSLRMSLAYATGGISSEAVETADTTKAPIAREETAGNTERLSEDDEMRSPVVLKDSGDDDLPPAEELAEERNEGVSVEDSYAALNGQEHTDPAQTGQAEEISRMAAGRGAAPSSSDEEEEVGEDQPMTLRDHLIELRKRVFRAFLWAVLGFFACYPFAEQIFAFLVAPLQAVMPEASHFIFTSPPEAFFTFIKVAFVAGFFATCPMIFYQVWAFIAPGLYKEEKLYLLPVVIFSAFFFICGGAFCYFIALPFAFKFFMSYNSDAIKALPKLNETLSFVLQLLVAFGFVFEMPLFAFFLARLGIVTADMMRHFRRYAVLGNVILAAVLTPPDVMSQLLMAVPLLLLYELSVLIAVIFGKKKKPPVKEEEEEETA